MSERDLNSTVEFVSDLNITRVIYSGERSDGQKFMHGTYMTGDDPEKLDRLHRSEKKMFDKFMAFDSNWTDDIVPQCKEFQLT